MAGKTAGTALTTQGAEQLEVIQAAIMGEAELPPRADPEAMSRAIMERILNASTVEEAFTQQNLTPLRTILDTPFRITDVHFNRSKLNEGEGAPVYAIVDIVTVDTGEAISTSCGGKNVLAQLVVGLKNGWLADNVFQLIANRTTDGYDALWLEALPS